MPAQATTPEQVRARFDNGRDDHQDFIDPGPTVNKRIQLSGYHVF
jgi:hypothetical protein